MDKLTDILKKLRARNPILSKRMDEAAAVSKWEEAVGPQIAKHARAIKIQDGTLWVEIDHPIWKTELHLRKRQLIDTLNERLRAKATPGAPPAPLVNDLLLLDARPRRE